MSKNWWGAAWTEKMERLAESSRFKEGAVAAAGNAVQPSASIDIPTSAPAGQRVIA